MKIIMGAIQHLLMGTFVEALKRQPDKYRRRRWIKFLESGKEYTIFKLNWKTKIKLYRDSNLSQYIFQKNYEKNETAFISEFLKPGDNFIDIGTNIGLFSLIVSKKVKKNGKVFSFEPAMKNYDRLIENLNLNGIANIIPIKKAISDLNGFLDLNISLDGYDAWNSFARPFWWKNYTSERVETVTLNNIFETGIDYRTIKLIKIDVEGWELNVVKGGEKYLSLIDAPTIIIEFVDENTKNAGYSCKELYQLLKKFGYNLYRLDYRQIIIESMREELYNDNLIATKDIQLLKRSLHRWKIEN